MMNPFNSPFGAGKPEQLPMSALAGKPAMGPGHRGRSKKSAGGATAPWTLSSGSAGGSVNGTHVITATSLTSQGYLADHLTLWASGGKKYWEFKVIAAATPGAEDFYFGFKAASGKDVTSYTSAISCRFATATGWYTNKSIGGTSNTLLSGWTVAAPAVNDIMGIAMDIDSALYYLHWNGTWCTNSGAPGVGPGITLIGTNDSYPFFGSLGAATSAAMEVALSASGLYTPAGYTILT